LEKGQDKNAQKNPADLHPPVSNINWRVSVFNGNAQAANGGPALMRRPSGGRGNSPEWPRAEINGNDSIKS